MTEQLIRVEATVVDGHPVLAVSGEIDISSAPVLRAAIDGLLADGVRQLIVDLDGVRFMDSTALNVLISVVKKLGPGSLRVVASQAHIRRIFSISGIDKVTPLFDSVADAVIAAPDEAASH